MKTNLLIMQKNQLTTAKLSSGYHSLDEFSNFNNKKVKILIQTRAVFYFILKKKKLLIIFFFLILRISI
jgi:hypothetical protein